MHVMEGFLPPLWAAFWWIISLPFIIYGFVQLKKIINENKDALPLLGICGALIFILSALKLPSVTGSCSHPTGTGLSAERHYQECPCLQHKRHRYRHHRGEHGAVRGGPRSDRAQVPGYGKYQCCLCPFSHGGPRSHYRSKPYTRGGFRVCHVAPRRGRA